MNYHSTTLLSAKAVPKRTPLTELSLRAAEPPQKGARTLWDGSLKHFGVRISQGGTKSFILLLASGRRQVIGQYPTLSLAQARTKAKLMLAERMLGKHTPRTVSWSIALEQFCDHCDQHNRSSTADEYRRVLYRHFPFGSTRLGDITRQDVAEKLERVKAPSMRSHAAVYIKIFFNWCIEEKGYLDTNPCVVSTPKKRKKAARILTDDELNAIWHTCSDESNTLSHHFRTIVKLLILTGQRRGEIAALHRSYFSHNQQTVCLPGELTKNHTEHTFPLGTLALPLLTSATPDPTSGLFFPARGKPDRPFNGWSKSKKLLDQLSGVTNWKLHNLRHTFKTNLSRMKVLPHISEMLLNHISARTDLEWTYDAHTYLSEMREAVANWDAHVQGLLTASQKE